MTASRTARIATALAGMLLGSAPAMAAECLEEVESVRSQMQTAGNQEQEGQQSAEEQPNGEQQSGQQQNGQQQSGQQQGQNQESSTGMDQSSQSNGPIESWQGGTQTGGSGNPAFNPEAAKWLEVATQLANNGETGGCWQVLVQAQRILGSIPADTPLPRVE